MDFIRLHALFDLSLRLTLQFVSSHLLFVTELFLDRNMQGVLLSNETVQITVRAYIDNAMALILNQGPNDLSATLILHTVLGRVI